MLVLVGGPSGTARLLDRRQFDFVSNELPSQAYHAAAELNLRQAEALIARWAETAERAAADAIGATVRAATAAGHRVTAAAIVTDVRVMPALPIVLRSHPLLHAGEGQLSREAVTEAAAAAGLAVHHLSPKGPHDSALAQQAVGLGSAAGPPWRKEHKLAALAALTALAALSS